ncbi:MAG: aspartate dehydrogenase [Burkholderiales bacterium]
MSPPALPMPWLGTQARVALIGCGAIADEFVSCLDALGESQRIVCALETTAALEAARARVGGRFPVTDSVAELLASPAELVIECAGQGALKAHAPGVLGAGLHCIAASTGAFADADFVAGLARLQAAGTPAASARLWIPSGAIAGVDGLLAARTAGMDAVTYTSAKPPHAWDGTPAQSLLQGEARTRRVEFFEGSAREAARDYPQNANVGATIALASLGLDRTRVKLVSDPALAGPLGIIDASGAFGVFHFDILAYASPTNPKTSAITAHSIALALRQGYCFAFDPASA